MHFHWRFHIFFCYVFSLNFFFRPNLSVYFANTVDEHRPIHFITTDLVTSIPKPLQIIRYNQYIGIEEITIFAFSIENFKRDPAETKLLMELFAEKIQALLDDKEMLVRNDMCFRCIGELTLLPDSLQKLIADLMLFTKNHKKLCVNICMSYTSSYEMSSAADKLYNAVNENLLKDEISAEDVNACLMTNLSQADPEMLIR